MYAIAIKLIKIIDLILKTIEILYNYDKKNLLQIKMRLKKTVIIEIKFI